MATLGLPQAELGAFCFHMPKASVWGGHQTGFVRSALCAELAGTKGPVARAS